MNTKELQEYRKKLYTDLYTNVIPDRVIVQDGLGIEFMIQYAGKDLLTTQYCYTDELLDEIFTKAAEDLMRGDIMPAVFARNAISIMIEQSISDCMGKSGFIQHPEHCYMQPDEYDEYIKNPYDFFIEKIAPRQSKQIGKGGAYRSRAVLMRQYAQMDQNAMFGRAAAKLANNYGFHVEPPRSTSITQPPFDMIADFARGFSQIPMDMRRCPEKLKEAMVATMPFLLKWGVPGNINVLGAAKIMTHMPGFLSTKQYEEFYLPAYYDMHHIYAEQDIYIANFLEQDWTRFVDSLEDFPMGTRFYMEQGDMKKFKDTLGKKHVLGGFYPLSILRSGTKEQCIDKAKEILDIMAPGGNYYFCWDKSALSLDDINVENYVAVMEYVRDNYKYDNAGSPVDAGLKKEDTIVKGLRSKYPEFQSKYVLSFEEYKKEYPPVDERAEPYMKAAYEKYLAMLPLTRSY